MNNAALDATEALFTDVVRFYVHVLLVEPSPWSRVHRRDKHTGTVVVDPQTGEIVTRQPTAHGVLTAAEAITIATRDHPNPAHDRASVPGARQAPVLFRRAAIHRAIGLVKAYRSNLARMPSTRRMGWRRRQNVRRAWWMRGRILEFVRSMALWEGILVVRRDPAFRSKACPRCGAHRARFSSRANGRAPHHTFWCPSCGWEGNADLVGALNLQRKWARTFPAVGQLMAAAKEARRQTKTAPAAMGDKGAVECAANAG